MALFVGLVSGGIASVVIRNLDMPTLPNGLSLGVFGAVGVVFAVFRLISINANVITLSNEPQLISTLKEFHLVSFPRGGG